MQKLNPYLIFDGNTEEAFNFYKSIFGGEFMMIQRFSEAPESGQVSDANRDKIMHISLPIGDNILMASDSPESNGDYQVKQGNNFNLSFDTESKEEADKIFGRLSEGGTVTMPMANTFWGSYFGMCTDKFGIQWMISYDEKKENK